MTMVSSGLYCYGQRLYAPDLQRWLNRDPIVETGFVLEQQQGAGLMTDPDVLQLANAYTFARNDPGNQIDARGLKVESHWPSALVATCFKCSGSAIDGAAGRLACCIHANTTCTLACEADYGLGAVGEDDNPAYLKACLADCALKASKCGLKAAKNPRKPPKDFPKLGKTR